MSLSHVEAMLGEEVIKLTKIEYEILKCLALKSGEVIHRNDIKKTAWKEEGMNTKNRTIDVHIRALRKKTNYFAEHIVSIYGVGYMYRV
jgi:two-component system phosphate regulon response regulator PhoB